MIEYAYLWNREADEGQEEGLKDRPVVVVLARVVRDEHTEVFVAPITHSPPVNAQDAILIPPRVKAQLGLDNEPSWIVATEVNKFIWPGPDIRRAKDGDTPLYGAIPAALFKQVQQAISDHVEASKLRLTGRTE